MPTITYSQQEYLAMKTTADELRNQVEVLESMRPQWAQGYTSDSMAAQSKAVALQQVWDQLGAIHQTQCMSRLKMVVDFFKTCGHDINKKA